MSAPDQQPPVPSGAVSKRLLAGTAGVCLAAVILGVAATDLVGAAGPTEGADSAGAPAAPAVLPTTAAGAAGAPAPAATALPASGGAAPVADPATAAAAVIAVRAAAPPDLYVDTAVVDEVTVLEGVTLVGVRAVVVPRVDGGWGSPATVRYAVPVGTVDGAVGALADPWRLAPPRPVGDAPDLTPVREPALVRAATQALTAAGYGPVGDVRLSRSDAVPDVLIATLRGTAPGDALPRATTVWLTGDALRVLGAPTSVDLPVPQEEP